ncbi:hypothetical protein IWQ56_004993 [Coemansia nantahalensis]|nr:hypothetical protein IWQ56_004993 [Coemansia nantahalensis]
MQTCRPVLMALVWAAGALWFAGDIAANVMVHLSRAPLTNCVFDIVWLRSSLGQNMILFLLLYRCISLLFEYRWGRAMTAGMRVAVGAFLLASDLLPAAISTILPAAKTIKYVPLLQVCQFNDTFKIAMVTLTWLELGTVVAFVAVLSATTRCAHREYRRLGAACVPLVVSAGLHSAIFFRKPRYPMALGWRLAVVSLDQASVLCAWWLLMGSAVYNCRFRHRQHLLEWRQASAAARKRDSPASSQEAQDPATCHHHLAA